MRSKEEGPEFFEKNEIKGREVEFPAQPERRLTVLLNSFSVGPRAVTFLLLPPDGSLISTSKLKNAAKEVFRNTEMANVDPNTFISYCKNTPYTSGLIIKEVITHHWGEELVGFRLTEAGKKFGVPAACLVLEFEKRNKISLSPILGPNYTPSSRGRTAVATREKMLRFLAKQKEVVRTSDVAQSLGISPSTAGNHLRVLAREGAIEYESVNLHTGETQITYKMGKLPSSRITPIDRKESFTQAVVDVCQALTKKGLPINQENVSSKLPLETKKRLTINSLRQTVSRMLSQLARQGYLTKGKFSGGETQSSVVITHKGKVIVSELILPLLSLATDNNAVTEKVEKEFIPRVKGNILSFTQSAAEFYYPHSRSYGARHRRKNMDKVVAILSQAPRGLTAGQLAKETGLHATTIRSYLSAISKLISKEVGKRLKQEKRKSVYYYRIQ